MNSHTLSTIESSRIDWNTTPSGELDQLVRSELTEKEVGEIDMRILGNIVYGRVFALSRKVNEELLKPISKWLDDRDGKSGTLHRI